MSSDAPLAQVVAPIAPDANPPPLPALHPSPPMRMVDEEEVAAQQTTKDASTEKVHPLIPETCCPLLTWQLCPIQDGERSCDWGKKLICLTRLTFIPPKDPHAVRLWNEFKHQAENSAKRPWIPTDPTVLCPGAIVTHWLAGNTTFVIKNIIVQSTIPRLLLEPIDGTKYCPDLPIALPPIKNRGRWKSGGLTKADFSKTLMIPAAALTSYWPALGIPVIQAVSDAAKASAEEKIKILRSADAKRKAKKTGAVTKAAAAPEESAPKMKRAKGKPKSVSAVAQGEEEWEPDGDDSVGGNSAGASGASAHAVEPETVAPPPPEKPPSGAATLESSSTTATGLVVPRFTTNDLQIAVAGGSSSAGAIQQRTGRSRTRGSSFSASSWSLSPTGTQVIAEQLAPVITPLMGTIDRLSAENSALTQRLIGQTASHSSETAALHQQLLAKQAEVTAVHQASTEKLMEFMEKSFQKLDTAMASITSIAGDFRRSTDAAAERQAKTAEAVQERLFDALTTSLGRASSGKSPASASLK